MKLHSAAGFLAEHARGLQSAKDKYGDSKTFTYGRVVNTSNFDDPTSEPFKITVRAPLLHAFMSVHLKAHLNWGKS